MFETKAKQSSKNMAHTILGSEESKRTYTVDEIQDILEISRTSAYSLVKQNLFRCVRIGGRIRISKKSFDEWLDAMQ